MSDKKETAIGWFIDKLNELEFDLRLIPNHIKQAKEMEKQQIIDAYERGDKYKFEVPGEQYYSETYEQ